MFSEFITLEVRITAFINDLQRSQGNGFCEVVFFNNKALFLCTYINLYFLLRNPFFS